MALSEELRGGDFVETHGTRRERAMYRAFVANLDDIAERLERAERAARLVGASPEGGDDAQ